MNNQILSALKRLFEKHRIIFWYDEKKEMRTDFDSLELSGIEKVEIADNEFGLKYRVLREQPKQQFLLYKEGPQPDDLNNWLLDIQLAHDVFRTDQSAIWLSELELPNEFIEIVEQHTAFFDAAKSKPQSEKRKITLKEHLSADDTLGMVRLKMLAVCVGSEPRIDNILENLLSELAKGRVNAITLIERCNLSDFLWEQVERHYAYQSEQPSIKDFSIELFKSCYSMGLGLPLNNDNVNLGGDTLIFFKRWKESRQHYQAFEDLSQYCAELLNIEADLNQRDIKELIECDYFRLIDRKVIFELVKAVETRTASPGDITLWCRQRRQRHWYDEFKHLYSAVDAASQFIALLETVQLTMATPTEAVHGYTRHWYKLDQSYRQYVYALSVSKEVTLFNSLTDQMENLYTNRYLLPLNNAWQHHVDSMPTWQVDDVTSQHRFFSRWVQPYINKKKKIYVIISDAFRYEAGEEMLGRIRQEDRYQATLDVALSSLPSYTQLGMASLLPQSKDIAGALDMPLTLADNKRGTVAMGSQSTQGTYNRVKVLKTLIGDRATAILTKDLMVMTFTETRDLLKDHDVIYFYHDRIDHTGDKMHSEGEAFKATEETFDDLIQVIKKLTNANASNLLITADHGFIYQNRALDDSDFLSTKIEGEVLYNDRRFVLGKNLSTDEGLKGFSAKQLGLAGDVSAVIPKGIQRLRLSGSGSRFVHGGASLQEVLVPVISINKKRTSDTEAVEVDILRGGSNLITSGQLAVTLYQTEPVTEKMHARKLRVGIYTESNVLISDQHEVLLDLSADNPRERELKLRFVLTQQADKANEKEVVLRLDEQVSGTNQFKEYKHLRYTIRRSFTSDFDF
jgi:uncharacterized protein (TIGR02687 family)